LRRVDVFFIVEKHAVPDLATARRAMLRHYLEPDTYRTVSVLDPLRDAQLDYRTGVDQWREERTVLLEKAILTELGDNECGAILVWGDPGLYDGTIDSIRDIMDRSPGALELRVVPGISSIAVLAARHAITLTRRCGAVLITTGRRLRTDWPAGVEDVVVMLDPGLSCQQFRGHPGAGIEIFWGAYLGSSEEVLIAGRLNEVIDEIIASRAALRRRIGWIMDCYLLRRSDRMKTE